jgi:hypothetical protein
MYRRREQGAAAASLLREDTTHAGAPRPLQEAHTQLNVASAVAHGGARDAPHAAGSGGEVHAPHAADTAASSPCEDATPAASAPRPQDAFTPPTHLDNAFAVGRGGVVDAPQGAAPDGVAGR